MRRGLSLIFFGLAAFVSGFDISANDNLVLYWGQEGGTLATVCADPNVDVVALAFLNEFFGTGGLPVINFAGSCNGPTFPGTDLLECPEIGQDIRTCQQAGKAILLSLGGAIGTYGFSSASQAQEFATTLWNLFGEGSSSTRPFGDSVVDGFDLDIENNLPNFYSDFITAMRTLFAKGSKPYYITGAPQCPFPDASLGQALDSSPFDMVFVQFYNNPPCGVESSGFNYDTWQNWASSAVNKDVKVFVGVPASSAAAGSGYISSEALAAIISSVQSQPNFGGVMMWDANQAFENVADGINYADAAKSALSGKSSAHHGPQSQHVVVASTPNPPPPAPTVQATTQNAVPTTFQTVIQGVKTQNEAAEKARASETVSSDPTNVAAASPTVGAVDTSSQSCSIGFIGCINGQFAQCVNGAYVLTSCPKGTTCVSIPIGGGESVVTCDYPTAAKAKRDVVKRHHHHRHRNVLLGRSHEGSPFS